MRSQSLYRLNETSRQWAMSALINRNFTLFLVGSFITAMGSWFQTVAIQWLVLELSNSTFMLGLSNFALMVPLLVLGLAGGALADRTDRRRLLLITQIIVAVFGGLLAAATYLQMATIPLVLGLVFLMGVTNAFLWPAWPTFIKDLVGDKHLRVAISANSARYNLTRVLGPALAGVFLAQFGVAHSLAVAAITGVAVILSVAAISLPPSPPRPSEPWLLAMRQGLAYVWHEPQVRAILLVTAVLSMLGMSYQAFMAAFARDVLEVGAWGLGLLLAAVGVGAVSGAIFAGTSLAGRNPQRVLALLALGTGGSLAAFAYSPNFGWALVTSAVLGFCSIGYLVNGNAIVQLQVPADLMGRVMGLWVVINAGTLPVGSLGLGGLSEVVGLPLTLALAGAGCALAGLALWRPASSGATIL